MAENANVAIQRGIVNGWTLLEFIRLNGVPDMQHNIANQETGETFSALFFPTPRGDKESTMVSISSKLEGVKTLDDIFKMRKELQVVELDETHNLKLCKQGGERESGASYKWIED